jgi:DNA-binding IclR family transcriptional regulator
MPQSKGSDVSNRTGAADEPVDAKPASSTRTLERGLAILDCYDVDHWGRTLMEICAETGLPKATAFRLLKTLEQRGYLTLDSLTGRYCLGPSMMKAGHMVSSHADLVRFAHPFLEKLASETSETAVLTAWNGEHTITLDYVLTPLPFKPYVRVGQPLTDLHNSHTQVYLAFMTSTQRNLIIARTVETGIDGQPIQPAAYERRLDKVRLDGVAYDVEERMRGVCGMAAPAFDAHGAVKATVGIIAPTERFRAAMNGYVAPLKGAARSLSARLGNQE